MFDRKNVKFGVIFHWQLVAILCVFLGQMIACESKPPFMKPLELSGKTVSAETLNRGFAIYHRNCATCHGVDGSGRGVSSGALKYPPRDFRQANFLYQSTPKGQLPLDGDLKRTIRRGVIERGMPGWISMTEEELDAVVQFIKTFSPKWQVE